jgi:orotate phosphoribosyltransferase
MNSREIILRLMDIEAIKFGNFTLKSGMNSPIYIDLRRIVSYPDLLREVAHAFWGAIKSLNFELLCGVPYTALPIATAISLLHDKPMVLRRKEAKDYGTKKIIEGNYKKNQQCLIIEDLITTGMSIFETIRPLEEEGLLIKDVAVLLDREQGGRKKLSDQGYRLHAIFTISELLEVLEQEEKVHPSTTKTVREFIASNQV